MPLSNLGSEMGQHSRAPSFCGTFPCNWHDLELGQSTQAAQMCEVKKRVEVLHSVGHGVTCQGDELVNVANCHPENYDQSRIMNWLHVLVLSRGIGCDILKQESWRSSSLVGQTEKDIGTS